MFTLPVLELLDTVLDFLREHVYLAMFSILFLCGLGLPIPEEVTLIGSGLLVGWGEADFIAATLTCVAGILAGDSIIFGAGYIFGDRFLRSRPMRIMLSPRRLRKVAKFFEKHGSKAVFFARFFAGVRIGVYAYAGSQRMNWFRFLFLDFLGALFSGGLSIWLGEWAAKQFAEDFDGAKRRATELAHEAGHWVLLGVAVVISISVVVHFVRRRRALTEEPQESSRER